MTEQIVNSEPILPLVREARAEDLEAINGFYHNEYGAEYPGYLKPDDLTDPSRLVVVAEIGSTVAGVGQATHFRNIEDIYELKGLVVKKEYRGKDIGKMLLTERIEMIKGRGAHAAYVEPIGREPACASAHNVMNQGFFMSGILPAKYPDELVVANQPESVATGLSFFEGSSGWGTRQLYLPDDYKKALDAVVPPARNNSDKISPTEEMPPVSHIPAETAEGRKGSDFAEIPINWPEALPIIENLRSEGYFLAGVLPGLYKTPDGQPFDTLMMYRPPVGVNLEFGAINVVDELKPLHDFMEKEYAEEHKAGV